MKPVMKQSAFLTQLSIDTLNKFDLFAEVVELRQSEKCIGAGVSLEYIYIPLTCVYSLELVMPDGIGSHLALLGREDAIGADNLGRHFPARCCACNSFGLCDCSAYGDLYCGADALPRAATDG